MPETTAPGTAATTTSGPAPVLTTAPASHESLGQRVGDFFHRADADVTALAARAPGIEAAITSHAGAVFDVAQEVIGLVSLIDPAASSAVAAGDVVLAKVLSMVQGAAAIAAKVTPPAPKPAG